MQAPARPLLLVDVDGVISLFGFPPEQRPAGTFHVVDGIAHYLSATAAEHLHRLAAAFELAWCTGWEEKADEHLPHLLGLPRGLVHLTFGTPPDGAHWKLAAIDAHAGPHRPLAWIDDLHDERCTRWADERPGPTLLVGTEPAVGITGAHVERLLAWARRVGSGHGSRHR